MAQIIYKATNLINGKSYIGMSKHSLWDRHRAHLQDCEGTDYHFHRAIRLYGPEAFEWEVLCECPTRKEAGKAEKLLIKAFDTFRNGYNMTQGGENPPSARGRIWTAESRRKASEAHKGKASPRKGTCLPQEHKAAISKASVGKSCPWTQTDAYRTRHSERMTKWWAERKKQEDKV